MLEIVLATRNEDKIKEIKKILVFLPVEFLSLKQFPHLPKINEDGKILKENALKKAKLVAKLTGKIALADDSGLEVEALNGAPGVFSSRFAGQGCTYAENNRKLLKLMKNVPSEKRNALFRCVLALATPFGKVKTVEGKIKGKISRRILGRYGFGYDPVFIVPSYGKTFAQLGPRIKNKISHRAQALFKIKKVISKMVNSQKV